jgi:hypothetical protein
MVSKLKSLSKDPLIVINLLLLIVLLIIQFVHFAEHLFQVSVWIIGYRNRLHMTPLGMWAMEAMGRIFFSTELAPRRGLLGLESLHFLGNGITLIGIIILYYFVRIKKVVWALAIQSFHFYEHISLTFSAIALNKSIGLSTLYGMDVDRNFLIAYRVWWHFIFNLVPTVLVAIVIYGLYKKYFLHGK